MTKRQRLSLIVSGFVLWLAGASLVVFQEVLFMRICGAVMFACGLGIFLLAVNRRKRRI